MGRSIKGPFTKVLVPLDGSYFAKQAIPYARAIAGQEANFILFQVVPKAAAIYGLPGTRLLTAEQVQRATEADARMQLERSREDWTPNSTNVEIDVVAGDYAGEILTAAERHYADIIVMATHGRGGLDRIIIGSIADRVARSSPIPVLLIHPQDKKTPAPADRSIERLIVPLDGSDLAAEALPLAAQMAIHLDIQVLCVAVSDIPHQLSMVSAYGSAFSQQVYDELLAVGRSDAEKTLASAASLLTAMGVRVSQQLLDGSVAKAIADATSENDVIVMTSHGHGGIRRWFLGSVATTLINHPRLAVLLARPVGQNGEMSEVRSA